MQCELHSNQIKEITESLKHIRQTLHIINTKMQTMDSVVIKNGGGREVLYKKDEFNQMVYDNGKTVMKKDDIISLIAVQLKELPGSILNKAGNISDKIYKILILVLQVVIIIKLIMK